MITADTLGPAAQIQISWSQLRTHMECKAKATLLRAGHRSAAGNLRSYFHGMVVDKAMRDWLADPHRRPGQMAATVDQVIEDSLRQAVTDGDGVVRWKHPGDRAELRAFCLELLRRLEPILADRVLPYRFSSALRFRQAVTVPYLDGRPTTIWLRGEMDLLVNPDTGRWEVWDLKGTADDSYWRKVAGQLFFYDLAVMAMHGTPTSLVGLIQPMCKRPVLEFTVTEDARRQMWAAILRMAGDIWRADTPCKPDTAGCRFCEVRHACPRYTGTTMASPGAGSLAAGLRAHIDSTTDASTGGERG